jgi:hypothetical protein
MKFVTINDIIGWAIVLTIGGVFILLLANLILRLSGKVSISKGGITLEGLTVNCILSKQMEYASQKSELIYNEQLNLVKEELSLAIGSTAYRFYKLLLTLVVDEMMDFLRSVFKNPEFVEKTDLEIENYKQIMFLRAKNLIDEWYLEECIGYSRDVMFNKCGKGLKDIWFKHGTDIFKVALDLQERIKRK